MLSAILSGLGLVKGIADAEKQKKENLAKASSDATAIQFSPWSGLSADKLIGKDYTSQSPVSAALAGGLSGFQTGANIEGAIADNGYRKQLAQYLKNKNSTKSSFTPWNGIGNDTSSNDDVEEFGRL